jgi:hypothetical protein
MYAKKHFMTFANDKALLGDLQRAMAMIIAPRKTQYTPYQDLMSDDRWEDLQKSFTLAYFSLYGLHSVPPLLSLVQLGCIAFKTPYCNNSATTKVSPIVESEERHSEFQSEPDRLAQLNCPCCSPELAPLVQNLPFAHFEFSRYDLKSLIAG